MPSQVALLRAVNVGGHQPVPMARLCSVLGDSGLRNVRSLLASGNLVFESPGRTGAKLEAWLEQTVRSKLELSTGIMIRSQSEWGSLVSANPFPRAAEEDPGHLLVAFLKTPPPPDSVDRLRATIAGREQVELVGREAFLVYPDGVGRSKLSGGVIERAFGRSATARNWNTVQKLHALASA